MKKLFSYNFVIICQYKQPENLDRLTITVIPTNNVLLYTNYKLFPNTNKSENNAEWISYNKNMAIISLVSRQDFFPDHDHMDA